MTGSCKDGSRLMLILVFASALSVQIAAAATHGRNRSQGGGQRLGGWKAISANNSAVQAVAGKGVEAMEAASNSQFRLKLMKVVSAKSQIVSGVNYRVNIQVGHTTCRKDQNVVNLRGCSVRKSQTCTLVIWEQAWLNSTQVTNTTCGRIKFARLETTPPRPGGIFLANSSDTSVKGAANFATAELATKSNGQFTINLHNIQEATYQVVSGMMYRMKIDVRFRNTQGNDKKQKAAVCLVSVWDQAWMTPRYRLQHYECDTEVLPSGESH